MENINVSKTKVNYLEPSHGRILLYNNIYITPNRLVKGNSKLHNILIFDLTAIKSCLNCKDCKDNCYAVKAQRMYNDTMIFRETNLNMVKNDLLLLKCLIIKQLDGTKINTVRIHSSGDFYNQNYVDMWNKVIERYPHINFYAYSKVEKILNFSDIVKHKNFNLITSFVNEKINFGKIDYCEKLNKDFNTFICPVGYTNKHKEFKCGKDCIYCVTEKNVCFVQH